MFPLILLLLGGGLAAAAVASEKKRPAPSKLESEKAEFRKQYPAAAASLDTALVTGLDPEAARALSERLGGMGFPTLATAVVRAAKTKERRVPEHVAYAVSQAIASGEPDVMRQLAVEMARQQYPDESARLLTAAEEARRASPVHEVAKTLEPSMGATLQAEFNRLLATEGDPAKLERVAEALEEQGYPAAAKALFEKAKAILIQAETSEALRETAAVLAKTPEQQAAIEAQSTAPAVNPTTAAVTSAGAATVANKVAEVLIAPSKEGVREVVQTAATLAKVAPTTTDTAPLIDAARTAATSPSPEAFAKVAEEGAKVAQQSATADVKPIVDAVVEKAAQLTTDPTPATASEVSTAASQVAEKVIDLSQIPLRPPGTSTYTVQAGDSPWSIAKKITGNGANYVELIAANEQKPTKLDDQGNETFSSLSAGEVLKLPERWQKLAPEVTTQAESIQTAPAGTPVTLATVEIAVDPTKLAPLEPQAQTYTVLSGDSPWRIAQKITGDGNRWRELVAANPEKKRAADGSFMYLKAGETLKLPDTWITEPAKIVAAGWPRPSTPHAPSMSQMGYSPRAA